MKRLRDIFCLGVPALAGAAGLLAATPGGIGVYPDSVMYIMIARSLLQGRGWTMEGVPVELFPPLYPALLALSGLFGADPMDGARWIQAAIWASNVFWAGLLTYQLSGKSLPAALFASIVSLAAVDLIAYHAIALSDGAFLFFFLPSLLALNRYLEADKLRYLAASAALTALAAITRYAGLAAIAGGILAIVLLERKAISRRIRHAVMFAAISFFPSALWMLRNLRYENAMGRSFDAHGFFGRPEIRSLLHTCGAWFLQWKIHDAWWMAILPVVLLALSILWMRSAVRKSAAEPQAHPQMLLIYMASYISLLVLTAAFFQADLFRDSARLMMPMHVLLLILAVATAQVWLKRRGNRVYQAAGIILALGASVFVVRTGLEYVTDMSSDGQGYAGRAYRNSALIDRTRSIQPDITVYTNLRLPIVLYTGRIPYLIPLKINNSTQHPNEQYDAEMKKMAADIRDSSALLVYFNREPGWFVLPTLDDIRHYVPLRRIAALDDGGVFEAVPDTAGIQ